MKKLALALVFGVFSMGAVSAQTVEKIKVKRDGKEVKAKQEIKGDKGKMHDAKTPEERADHMVKRMTSELNLTDAQATQVRELNLRKAQQMEAFKAQARENKEANRQQMKEIKTNYQNDLKNILTAEQFQKFEAQQAERQEKMKARHAEHKGERKDNGKHKGHSKNKKN